MTVENKDLRSTEGVVSTERVSLGTLWQCANFCGAFAEAYIEKRRILGVTVWHSPVKMGEITQFSETARPGTAMRVKECTHQWQLLEQD